MSRDTCMPVIAFGSPSVQVFGACAPSPDHAADLIALPGRFAVPLHPVGASDLDYGVPMSLAEKPDDARWFDESVRAIAFAKDQGRRYHADLEYPGVTPVYHPGHRPDMEDPFASDTILMVA